MMEALAERVVKRSRARKQKQKVGNRLPGSTSAAVADKTPSPPMMAPNTPDVPKQAADHGQRIIRLKQWLSTHSCLTFSVLLLLQIVMWILLIWIMPHLGLPCFLVALVNAFYDGPLQKGLQWAMKKMKKMQGKNGETHK